MLIKPLQPYISMRSLTLFSLLSLIYGAVYSQSLPPPGRTIYKCEQGKRVVYTDEPCVGAKALDIVVPRGMDKLSGQQRTGEDVRNEIHREGMAEALRPLTGMTAEQFKTATRRQRLSNPAQAQCRHLDLIMPQAEARERGVTGEALRQAQLELYKLRKQYKLIGC